MSLGGIAPLFAAALLSGATGAHMTAAQAAAQRDAGHSRSLQHSALRQAPIARTGVMPARSPSPSPSATPSLSPGVTSTVLSQVGPQKWQATVLIDDSALNCRASAAYWLETTTPGTATGAAIRGYPEHQVLAPHPAAGSSCQVTVTFNGLRRVPATAALDIDQAGSSSTVTLTVSRAVSLSYYLGIPAIVGGVMVLVMFLGSLWFVRLYREDGQPLGFLDGAFWTRPLSASGAWTLNDSWATNITALLVLIGTVLGVTTATGALFPGVAVDRFVIVNIGAGGIVAVAPLVFGVLYAAWTKQNPGVMADATLRLPIVNMASMATLAAPARVTLPQGTPVGLPAGETTPIDANTQVLLQSATTILLPGGGTITLDATTRATLPGDAAATLPPGTRVRLRGWWTLLPSRRPVVDAATPVHLPAGAHAELRETTVVTLPGDGSATLPAGAPAALLLAKTAVTLPGGAAGHVARNTEVTLPPGAAVTPPGGTLVRLTSDQAVTLPDGATARLPAGALAQHGLPTGPQPFTIADGATATLNPDATAKLSDVGKAPVATIKAPSGASVMVPGGGDRARPRRRYAGAAAGPAQPHHPGPAGYPYQRNRGRSDGDPRRPRYRRSGGEHPGDQKRRRPLGHFIKRPRAALRCSGP